MRRLRALIGLTGTEDDRSIVAMFGQRYDGGKAYDTQTDTMVRVARYTSLTWSEMLAMNSREFDLVCEKLLKVIEQENGKKADNPLEIEWDPSIG